MPTDSPNWSGRLEAIYLARSAGAPMQRVTTVEALAGLGLEGDRYAEGEGSFSRWPGAGRALTLIDSAALDAAAKEFGVAVGDGEHRRNLVVREVPLADLVGATFRVGPVELKGVRICAPCKYLVRLTGQERIFDALIRRGGLRAEILVGGTIRQGDAVGLVPGSGVRAPLPG